MSPMNTALKIISTIENTSFILYVYYCHLNHLFCQILVGTVPVPVYPYFYSTVHVPVHTRVLASVCVPV